MQLVVKKNCLGKMTQTQSQKQLIGSQQQCAVFNFYKELPTGMSVKKPYRNNTKILTCQQYTLLQHLPIILVHKITMIFLLVMGSGS